MATQTADLAPLSPEEKELLAHGTLVDHAIQSHPRDFYRAMRKGDPVHYDEKLGSWLVTRHEDIIAVQADSITYSVNLGYLTQQARGMRDEFEEILKRDGGGYFPDAIMSDPPYHTRIRKLMENAFTAHRVKDLEPRIRQTAVDLLDRVAAKGEADAVKDIAVPLTIRVIVDQLGLDHGMEDKISRWSMAVIAQISSMQSREAMVENAHQICDLQHYLIGKMRAREAKPAQDMISDIVHAKIKMPDGSEETLTFEEAVSLVRAMLIAGNDTTATAIGNLFFLLGTDPQIAQLLKDSVDDERRMNRFVEELLRSEPPVRALSRMTTCETVLGATKLPKHAHMLLIYGSGNDQEDVFPNPRAFDIDRPNIGRHVAFGGGVHRCVGLSLARMEIKVMAQEIARRMDNIKLAIAVEDITYVPTVTTRTIEHLPITFTRRA
jgi:cytochrome P450